MYDIKPNIGAFVRVTTRHKESYLFSNNEFRETTYYGKIIKAPYNISEEEFAMEDKTMPYKHRIFNLRKIVNIELVSGTVTKVNFAKQSKVISIEVDGSNGKKYTVTNKSGNWTCTCPGFQFRRQCKHTQNVQLP